MSVEVVADSIEFQKLVELFEQLQKCKERAKQNDALHTFLASFRVRAAEVTGPKNTTVFPILRLLLPEHDRDRGAYNLKERKLGELYVRILSLHKPSSDAQKLLNFRAAPGSQHAGAGDFASVAYFVVRTRVTGDGALSVGDVNELLDRLANVEVGQKAGVLDEVFLQALGRMTALQHKWFIRLVLKDLKLGLSHKRALSAFHPDAPDLFDVCNSLSQVCEELQEGATAPAELGARVYCAVSPMLAERLELARVPLLPLAAPPRHHIEPKLDGERFQIHMEGGVFAYYSRRGHCYTEKFGADYSSGALTPRLQGALAPGVQSFILDGEMMGWHKERHCFGSKGMAFDIKKITEHSKYQACFCAYDLLYYNGRSLVGAPAPAGAGGCAAGLPLAERALLLDAVFKDVPGTIVHTKRTPVSSSAEVVEALVRARDAGEEGLVLKEDGSQYVASRRNAGWYKLKPEYSEGAMEDLDLVIVGGDYAENKAHGLLKNFYLALADVTPGGAGGTRWVCVGKVATGVTFEERERLCAALAPHCSVARLRPPPDDIHFGRERPELWLHPSNSCVLQVRATELVRSPGAGAQYTLRFPRVVRVRDDKPPADVLTLDEFNALIQSRNSVIKLTKSEGSLVEEARLRRKRPARVLQVAEPFRPSAQGGTQEGEQAQGGTQWGSLSGRKLCVLSADEHFSKAEAEDMIRELGGTVVQNPGSDTWACVAGLGTVRVANVVAGGAHDVARLSWLRALHARRHAQHAPASPPEPLHLLASCARTAAAHAERYDRYGLSYDDDVDVDTLRVVFDRMGDDIPRLSKEELDALRAEIDRLAADTGMAQHTGTTRQ